MWVGIFLLHFNLLFVFCLAILTRHSDNKMLSAFDDYIVNK